MADIPSRPGGQPLDPYEAQLLDILLPAKTETVYMSSLQMPGSRMDIGRIPEAMYADARLRGWFRRVPEHLGALTGYGIGVLLAGLVVTAVLAISIGNAMIGVAVCGVGAVCALAGMLLPVRTTRGHLLVAHVARCATI